MLNDNQIRQVWENMLAAETRGLYFADLTSQSTRQKQWITGLSFLFSSGAAATIIAETPSVVPMVLALVVAAMTAYATAVNLDGRIRTTAKLHASWNQIAALYDRLWNHTAEADAEAQLDAILQREREPSELAAESAPNDEKRMLKWQERVFSLYHLQV